MIEVLGCGSSVSIRKLIETDLQTLANFEYSVSITEPHSDVQRLRELLETTGMWQAESGAVGDRGKHDIKTTRHTAVLSLSTLYSWIGDWIRGPRSRRTRQGVRWTSPQTTHRPPVRREGQRASTTIDNRCLEHRFVASRGTMRVSARGYVTQLRVRCSGSRRLLYLF